MTIPIPDLDDRRFNDLLEEALSLIPRYSKDWTNYNPSDPGITLVELFCWLSEMVMYRTDQVTEQSTRRFLDLVLPPVPGETGEAPRKECTGGEDRQKIELQSLIDRAVRHVDGRHRMIAAGDYEELALVSLNQRRPDIKGRVLVVFNRNLESSQPALEKPGHVSVILVPSADTICDEELEEQVAPEVKSDLEPARLITHRLHVTGPRFKNIHIKAQLLLEDGVRIEETLKSAEQNLILFYDPVTGGPTGEGWPLGRNLYRSEIYQVLEGTEGVDHVKWVVLDDQSEQSFVIVQEYEFIRPVIEVNYDEI